MTSRMIRSFYAARRSRPPTLSIWFNLVGDSNACWQHHLVLAYSADSGARYGTCDTFRLTSPEPWR